MRALFLSCALAAALAAPLAAQAPRFIKVDVVSKSLKAKHHEEGPSQVHIRMPLALAKGILESVSDKEISINGTVDEAGKAKHINGTIEFANVVTSTSVDAVLGLTAPSGAPDATSTDRCNSCHSTASVNGLRTVTPPKAVPSCKSSLSSSAQSCNWAAATTMLSHQLMR